MIDTGHEKSPAAEWVPITALKKWAQNPRKNDDAVQRVADSIKRFGFGAPIIARREDGEVIAGHTRLRAAERLHIDRVPVRFLDLDPADAHLLALADNRLGEIAEWDDDALGRVLAELKAEGADLTTTGFDDDEIANLLKQVSADATPVAGEDPGPDAPPENPVSVRGEVYALGTHRLMCGDATVVTDLETLMNGCKVDMVFTDPPYNVAYTGKTKEALTIQNDSQSDGLFRQFLRDAFAASLAVTVPGGPMYVCHASMETGNFHGAAREAGWEVKQFIIWVKDQFVMSRQDYHWQHEPILYGWAPGAAHRWFSDRKQTTVWNFPRPKRNADHPTMKPIDLIEYALTNSSDRGDVVLDSFGGSGSTLIAAARKGRAARLLELDPRYCDVIRKRWTKFARSAGVDPGSGALE